MKNNFNRIIVFTFAIIALMLIANITLAEDSFENTIKKINLLENGENKVEYEKIQPLKDQYCFIKVQIRQEGDTIIKEEILECADGKKGIDTPGYWELFAQFYYRDIGTPEYCRYYSRKGHAFKTPGKVCLDVNGEWEVR